jgi:hypothetical protein
MKFEKTKLFLFVIAIVMPADDDDPPPDDANACVADSDTLGARLRERLRPMFPQQYPLH